MISQVGCYHTKQNIMKNNVVKMNLVLIVSVFVSFGNFAFTLDSISDMSTICQNF